MLAKKLEPSRFLSKIWLSVSEEDANKSSPEFISLYNFVLPAFSVVWSEAVDSAFEEGGVP